MGDDQRSKCRVRERGFTLGTALFRAQLIATLTASNNNVAEEIFPDVAHLKSAIDGRSKSCLQRGRREFRTKNVKGATGYLRPLDAARRAVHAHPELSGRHAAKHETRVLQGRVGPARKQRQDRGARVTWMPGIARDRATRGDVFED